MAASMSSSPKDWTFVEIHLVAEHEASLLAEDAANQFDVSAPSAKKKSKKK